MLKEVIKALLNTTKTVVDVQEELDANTEVSINDVLNVIDTCSNCSQWKYKKDLHPDLDGFPTCKVCLEYYGY